MPSEKSRVLAKYGPKIYQETFKTKKAPSKKQIKRARSLWFG